MKNGEPAGSAFVEGQLRRGRRRFGSYIVHAAVVIVIIAIAISSSMRQQTELHFARKGQTLQASGYDVTFLGIEQRQEPHRFSIIATFIVAKNGKELERLSPRMNHYQSMREPIGSPDVHSTAARDFYISLSNVDTLNDTASISVYVAPMVMWIWLAVIAMALGALVALIPTRAVILSSAKDPLPADAQPETA